MFTEEFLNGLASEIAKRIQPNHQSPEKLAYKVPEAARMLNISKTKLWEEIRERRITILKSGTSVLVTKAGMLEWLDAIGYEEASSVGSIAWHTDQALSFNAAKKASGITKRG